MITSWPGPGGSKTEQQPRKRENLCASDVANKPKNFSCTFFQTRLLRKNGASYAVASYRAVLVENKRNVTRKFNACTHLNLNLYVANKRK